MKLYRPVGLKEYRKVQDTAFKKFPPRFSYQPIFYPVLNKEYACQIAKDWNTKDKVSDYVGIVLEFDVNNDYISKFKRQVVGNSSHEELWVPSEELEELNSNIIGEIKVIIIYYGELYKNELIEKV